MAGWNVHILQMSRECWNATSTCRKATIKHVNITFPNTLNVRHLCKPASCKTSTLMLSESLHKRTGSSSTCSSCIHLLLNEWRNKHLKYLLVFSSIHRGFKYQVYSISKIHPGKWQIKKSAHTDESVVKFNNGAPDNYSISTEGLAQD